MVNKCQRKKTCFVIIAEAKWWRETPFAFIAVLLYRLLQGGGLGAYFHAYLRRILQAHKVKKSLA